MSPTFWGRVLPKVYYFNVQKTGKWKEEITHSECLSMNENVVHKNIKQHKFCIKDVKISENVYSKLDANGKIKSARHRPCWRLRRIK